MGEQPTIPEFLSGGGEMGERIRAFDWSSTPLGPLHTWPQSLRTCIRIMLTSRQPIWMSWGKEHINLYNDAYQAILGGKHPWALGQPASLVWREIWKDWVGPLLHKVMEKDEGSYHESQLLLMERNGYPEETYYTFSYTPIPGDDGVTAGMICFNSEDTARIINDRQLRSLTQLGNRLTGMQTGRELIEGTIATLEENPRDFTFALFYTVQDNIAMLAHATDLGSAVATVPLYVNLQDERSGIASSFTAALETRQLQVVDVASTGLQQLPVGVWEIPASKAIVLPITQTNVKEPYGILVLGANPYRLLDELYRTFVSLIGDQVASSFGKLNALEEERKRAESLAALDRAKTTFFSNISHEFRTPLTLLLGPIEETLLNPGDVGQTHYRMEVALRNALRMQKLVNTLLEFSRIEAGRVEGKFSKVDIVSFTRDLVSLFRSAVEKAGMQLHFRSGRVSREVYVDTDMWEKIVLNLVSNAFKYTNEGSIEVSIGEADGRHVQLSVRDTGTGIPEEHLDKVFDRFHRVENREGRSQEGTGIGLAMVKELVRFHQGAIHVASTVGRGSVFTVSIPVGKEHLPAERISETMEPTALSGNTVSYVEEALKWIPGVEGAQALLQSPATALVSPAPGKTYRILLADDNADMRDYIYRLLADQYEVIMAVDGKDAFDKVLHYKPHLVLSDIMMPRMDGFDLLEAIRRHPDAGSTPVIFLSARAGEEAKVEGLEAGADDYLVKPFSAKELMATVRANIKIAQYHQELEEEVRRRTAELRELNINLRQSNNDLQQFAHVASHDLKEPLRKIRTFAGRLADDEATALSEKSRIYLEKVNSATNRMFHMIEGVLNYSTFNALEQEMGLVPLQEVMRSIESDLELVIQQKGAVIEYGDLPEIEGAPVLLHQVFYNLLNNALKFSRPDVQPFIHISSTLIFEQEVPFVVVHIRDNGIGFDQQHAEKIFDTFARLNSKDQYEGTGLGLSLCRNIVQRHGGSIQAMGKKQEGALFTVQLPVKQASRLV